MPRPCPDCLLPLSECVCEDDGEEPGPGDAIERGGVSWTSAETWARMLE